MTHQETVNAVVVIFVVWLIPVLLLVETVRCWRRR